MEINNIYKQYSSDAKGADFFMRGTSHNGRVGKNGVYSVKHNDRNFDVDSAEHIDKDRMDGNWYWQRYHKEQDMTFEDCEKRFYEENFKESLNAKNERYRVSGHKERMKTMDEYRENRLSCPEETLLQVGKTGESIDPDLLKQICIEHINWEMKTFPNVKVLDAALHVDEDGAPHMHERKVWIAHSDEGLVVGQAKALDEMGIQRPHPEKKKDRYNNPKTTYTAMCREHFLEVCKEHGLEIELEPDKASKRGLELTEYKRKQEQEKAEQAQKEAEQAKLDKETAERAQRVAETAQRQAEQARKVAEQKNKELKEKNEKLIEENEEIWREIEAIKGANEQLQTENEKLQTQNDQKQTEIDLLDKNITEAQNTLKRANEALQQVQDKSEELENLTAEVEQANKQLEQVLDMKARASEIHKIFGDKETQTYHKNMLESTRAIGHEAYERMQDAQARERRTAQRERKLDAREQSIQRKEREIEPIYQKASRELEKAQEYKENVKDYIIGTAKNIIKKIQPEQDKMSDKMRKFMSEYNINGQSLDKIFDQKQVEERIKQQAEMEETVRNMMRSREDWDLEL